MGLVLPAVVAAGRASGPLLTFADGTFTRSSTATDGIHTVDPVSSYAIDELRSPVSIAGVTGAIFEGSRTNLVLYSADASNWTTGSGTINTTSGQGDIFDGTDWYLVEDASTGEPSAASIVADVSAPSRSTKIVCSLYAKKTASSHVCRVSYDEDATNSAWSIDLSDGSSQINNDEYGDLAVEVQDVSADWWRFVWTLTTPAGSATDYLVRISPASGTLSSFDSTQTGGSVFGGLQVEEGSFPSSYIPTNGATATRSEDSLTYDLATEVPNRLSTGRWKFTWVPFFQSSDVEDANFFDYDALGNGEELSMGSGQKINVIAGASVVLQSAALTYSAFQPITVTVDAAAGEMTVEGATSGNGTTSSAPWSWPTTGTLTVGGVGSPEQAGSFLISEPEAA